MPFPVNSGLSHRSSTKSRVTAFQLVYAELAPFLRDYIWGTCVMALENDDKRAPR